MDLRSYRVCTAVVVCIRLVPKHAFILHASMPDESIPTVPPYYPDCSTKVVLIG